MAEPTKTKVNENHVTKYDLGGDYFRGVDLLENGSYMSLSMTISGFFAPDTVESSDGKKIKGAIIEFAEPKGNKRRMVLNKTNQHILHLLSGSSNGYKSIGLKVKIGVRVVKSPKGGKTTGLYILPPAGMMIGPNLNARLGTPAEWEGHQKSGDDFPHKGPKPDESKPQQ